MADGIGDGPVQESALAYRQATAAAFESPFQVCARRDRNGPRCPSPQEYDMTQIADIMTRQVQAIAPRDSLQRAATLMRQLDIGALPVTDGQKLVGVVTDRDITVRGVAAGLLPAQASVSDVMSDAPRFCRPDQDVAEVMRLMGQYQLRRMPVVESGRLVGIVALADIARRQDSHIDRVVREVSEPNGPAGSSDTGSKQRAA
jgi:CBS domain-containing protein